LGRVNGLACLLVLFLGHWNIIDDKELASALVACLSGHEESVEQGRCADSRFLFAVRADALLQGCPTSLGPALRQKRPEYTPDPLIPTFRDFHTPFNNHPPAVILSIGVRL
jgi:hypothetical protein